MTAIDAAADAGDFQVRKACPGILLNGQRAALKLFPVHAKPRPETAPIPLNLLARKIRRTDPRRGASCQTPATDRSCASGNHVRKYRLDQQFSQIS